jgi:two-component system, cell cycle response regulator DivK
MMSRAVSRAEAESSEPTRSPVPSSGSSGSQRRRPRRPLRVLIADDTADARDLYAQYFRFRGFAVLTARDGAEAIQVALEQRPDVIVMDLAMPQFDGITATRRIKADPRASRARVLLLTGYPQMAVERDARDAGVELVLTKPCLAEDLERRIDQMRGTHGVP